MLQIKEFLTFELAGVHEVYEGGQQVPVHLAHVHVSRAALLEPGGEHGLEVLAAHRQDVTVRLDRHPISSLSYK